MGQLRNIWNVANEIKSAWEWAVILTGFGLLPAAPIVASVVTGASTDVLLLYLVAAVAFWFVFVIEGVPALDELLLRRHRRTVAALLQLRDKGVALRNEHLHNEVQWIPFHGKYEAWDKAVIQEMQDGKVRATDIARFRTLDRVPALEFEWAINELHAKDLRELSEKLARLTEITARFEK